MRKLSFINRLIVYSGFLSFCGCTTPAPITVAVDPSASLRESINRQQLEKFSDTRSVDIYYVTNRTQNGDPGDCSSEAFSVTMSDVIAYGMCRVNVPKRHTIGELKLADNPRADTHRFYRVLQHRKMSASDLVQLVGNAPGKRALVFVHGFNVKFNDAVLRASQIAYDLKYQGPVILFSWPAGAAGGLLNAALINRTYDANRNNARQTVAALTETLNALAQSGTKIDLMVHSMGHQLVVPALYALANQGVLPFINELIFNAPDVDQKEFADMAPKILGLVRRASLYCSYKDNAIVASETLNGGRRMGACERIDGVDVINVSEVDSPALGVGGLGHGYYASRIVLTDVWQILMGIDADRRLFVRKSEPNSTEDFYLRP